MVIPTDQSDVEARIHIAFYRVSALTSDGQRPSDVLWSLVARICGLPFTGHGLATDRYRLLSDYRRDFLDYPAPGGPGKFLYISGDGRNSMLLESHGVLSALTLDPGQVSASQNFGLLIPDDCLAVASVHQPASPRTLTSYLAAKFPSVSGGVSLSRLVTKDTVERLENHPMFSGFTIALLPSRIEAFKDEDERLYGAAKAKQDFCGLERVIVLPFKVGKPDQARMAAFLHENIRRWRSSNQIRDATQRLTVGFVDPDTGRTVNVDVISESLTATASVRRVSPGSPLVSVDEVYLAITNAAQALAPTIDSAYRTDVTWLNGNKASSGSMAIQSSLLDLLQE